MVCATARLRGIARFDALNDPILNPHPSYATAAQPIELPKSTFDHVPRDDESAQAHGLTDPGEADRA